MFSRIQICSKWNVIGFRKQAMFHQSTFLLDKAMVNVQSQNEDSMMTSIKSANNTYELLNVISKNVKQFSPEQTLTALKKIFELQKNASTSIDKHDITQNSDFEQLCRSLKQNARHMELNDVIEALKIISFVGTEASSEITMSLLNLIKYQINDISLGHIVFLNFLLRRLKPNPLVDALKLALPLLLQIQIGTKMDYENVAQLTELLIFVSRHRVSDQCVMNIVNGLTLHGDELNLEQARSIVWSLSTTSILMYNPSCEKLLVNAINVLKRDLDKEEFATVCTTLKKMVAKYLYDPVAYEKFYDEALYNKCADFVLLHDLGFENATYIQRQLNKLSFVSIKLLKYMLREGEKYPKLITDGKSTSVIALITALSQANYKPDNWHKIESLIKKSDLLTNNKRWSMPWFKLSSELLSLGIECPSIWETIFSAKYLNINNAGPGRKSRLLRLLELYQFVKVMTSYDIDSKIDEMYLIEAKELVSTIFEHPMKQYLESAVGGSSFVYTKVKTPLGHVFDHLIAFDKETMEPIRIDENELNYDVCFDITTSPNRHVYEYVAVVTFPPHCYCINMPILRGIYELKLRTFEKMGIRTVLINHSTWTDLLEDEKVPYLQREIRLKLTQLQSSSAERQ